MRFVMLLILVLIRPDVGAEAQAPGGLYKWEDAEGQIHFSDRPPTGPVSHVDVQPIPQQTPARQGDEDDYYSIENQAKRLEEERKRRDQERGEADRRRLEEQERRAKIEAARLDAERRAAIEAARLDAERRAAEYWRDCCPVYVLPVPPIPRPPPPVRPPERPAPIPESHIRGGLLR